MRVDLDKFLVCNKSEKTIYGKSFGFVTIQCLPSRFEVAYSQTTLGAVGNYGYSTGCLRKEVSFNNIFVAFANNTVNENGRRVAKYDYKPFSFNYGLKNGEILAVKIGNGYYRLQNFNLANSILMQSTTNNLLIKKNFGATANGSKNDKGTFYSISPIKLKEVLETVEWREDDNNQCVDISNIKELSNQTKVFIDSDNGGEGEIVALKSFNVVERTAIYEILRHDGVLCYVNIMRNQLLDERGTVKDNGGCSVKLIVSKEYVPKNEFVDLVDSIAEDVLYPFIRKMEGGFNVYWQPIEAAMSYNVELYTWNKESIGNKLYKMVTKTIERNQYYTSFENLAKGEYGIRVVAEDRTGKIVAINKIIIVTL